VPAAKLQCLDRLVIQPGASIAVVLFFKGRIKRYIDVIQQIERRAVVTAPGLG